MRIFIFAAVLNLALFLSACSSEEAQKKSLNDANESVQIESSDEKSEVNDTNVPLPVEEESTKLSPKSTQGAQSTQNMQSAQNAQAKVSSTNEAIAKFYAKNCAFCHGKDGAQKALGASKIIKDMSVSEFANSLKGYQAGSYGGAFAAQMKPYATMLTLEQIDALATLIAKGG